MICPSTCHDMTRRGGGRDVEMCLEARGVNGAKVLDARKFYRDLYT